MNERYPKCPTCQGTGKNKSGTACQDCDGNGSKWAYDQVKAMEESYTYPLPVPEEGGRNAKPDKRA